MVSATRKPGLLEARIIIESRRDGRCDVFCFDPVTNKSIEAGLKPWPGEVDKVVRDLQVILLRAGNRVSVIDKRQ